FIGVPPFVPPGNGWLKKPAGTVKPPVPFTFTTAGVMPARSAPPGMQPPGFCGRGPISFVCVLFAGEYPPPKPSLPVIDRQGTLPSAGRSTNAPEPVAALPVIEYVAAPTAVPTNMTAIAPAIAKPVNRSEDLA